MQDRLSAWLRDGGSAALDLATGKALDVVGLVDPQLIVRYVNWTAGGLTRHGVIGGSALDLAPPLYRELAREHYLRVLSTGVGSSFEISYEGEHQLLMWEVRVGPVCVNEEVIGLITISTEVTEQRRAEADRDRFFSLSLDMLVVVSPTGHLKRLNPAFGEALGYASSELIDRPFADFLHPDDRAEAERAFQGVLAGTPAMDFENRYRRRDGTYRMFSWRAIVDPITADVYAVARDITAQRAIESQLRRAQKMEAVGQLAGGIAHDFNNLMQAVLANADLALTYPACTPQLAERLDGIKTAANRAAALTKSLLAFSRQQPLHPVPVDLNELITGLFEMLRRLLPENIHIELVADPALSSVNVDRTQLEQVIVNLSINARDAMERGGTLTLKTENVSLDAHFCESHSWARPGPWVLLTVTDTGSGMTPAVCKRIFEPFFTTKGATRGTGLGLATVYGIVRQHGGMIHVNSEPDAGATFRIHLPADGRTPEHASSASDTRIARGQETILFAEDESAVREAAAEMLRRNGYQVLTASDGAEAIALLRAHPERVHLAILDIIMPVLDGPETWEQLRELRAELKVLFVSGYAAGQHRERLPANAELLAKPFEMQELLSRVRKVLDEL